ncbi:MAG: type II toxin-antitoxin system mRNA interferase toxin, RelE/StbE family [Bacteroidota bacterium]|nr:type II toxin-antitoxin system mRNA interferase toxin, RelE/StbE family [Bacteroidota bacterium]MDP4233064.1 type II toxin-antitoxin system mRNA interferase toxin, RelE/StbE family [Bacteroidota bacterium]MDP4241791.1 type II toxin-antitoxin system mRNA interferase toxin, RelE/StbE family [Bacteroidota bacterium]MDP4288788.1 type II toxin-antitoxin system mRNA interferase toxin, RelE/StbE family [Bacteroidota bacterium]
MVRIVESSGFIRAYAKLVRRRPELREKLQEKLEVFVKNPFDPSLDTHKLSGHLKDSMAFSLTRKLRVVFSFVKPDLVTLEDIGNHDDVY